jgi:hypothetical protein
MQDLIPRCWAVNPNDRPSFQAIFEAFKVHEFVSLPGADGQAISRAVSEVLKAEEKQLPSN